MRGYSLPLLMSFSACKWVLRKVVIINRHKKGFCDILMLFLDIHFSASNLELRLLCDKTFRGRATFGGMQKLFAAVEINYDWWYDSAINEFFEQIGALRKPRLN